jgi:hypothetical protein
MASLCEDYPCCGHTPDNPCTRQWYDEPGAFDMSIPGNEHALCDHENGVCEVEYLDEPDDDEAELQHEIEEERKQRQHEEMITNDADPFFGP